MSFKRKSFTLTELLVVIAVVATLFSLLQPSLKKLISSSRSVSCKNNLKQIHTGIAMYIDEFEGWIPVMGRNRWTWETAGYLNFKVPEKYNEWTVHNYIDASNTVMECPSFLKEDINISLPPIIGGYASNFRYLCHTLKDGKGRIHYSQVLKPSETLVIGDGQNNASIWWHLRYLFPPPTEHEYARHDHNMNMFFLDGHVTSMSWEELKLGRNGDARYYYRITK